MRGGWSRASCPACCIPGGHRRRPQRRCACWPVFGTARRHRQPHAMRCLCAACVASAAVHACWAHCRRDAEHGQCCGHHRAAWVASAAVHASCPDRRAPQHNPRRDHGQTETTPLNRCHPARGMAGAGACVRVEQHCLPLPYISKIDENRSCIHYKFCSTTKMQL